MRISQRIKKLEEESASKKLSLVVFHVKDCLTIEERDRERRRLRDEYVAKGNALPKIVVFSSAMPRFLDANVETANSEV
jgi:hypothetical protein